MAKQKTHKPALIETVNPEVTDAPVCAFGTLTHDLHDLANWFISHGVTSVAMESTGVYWIPAYEILKQHGFEVILANARYAKNVPGLKTDVSDASWLRHLNSYGLFDQRLRLQRCGPICANVNDWRNMQLPTFRTCRRLRWR